MTSPFLVTSVLECRPIVQGFAMLMENELRWNDFKPGWKEYLTSMIMTRIRNKLAHLTSSLARANSIPTLRIAIDMAIYLMFLMDNERLCRTNNVRPDLQIVATYRAQIANRQCGDADRRTWEQAIVALDKLGKLTILPLQPHGELPRQSDPTCNGPTATLAGGGLGTTTQ